MAAFAATAASAASHVSFQSVVSTVRATVTYNVIILKERGRPAGTWVGLGKVKVYRSGKLLGSFTVNGQSESDGPAYVANDETASYIPRTYNPINVLLLKGATSPLVEITRGGCGNRECGSGQTIYFKSTGGYIPVPESYVTNSDKLSAIWLKNGTWQRSNERAFSVDFVQTIEISLSRDWPTYNLRKRHIQIVQASRCGKDRITFEYDGPVSGDKDALPVLSRGQQLITGEQFVTGMEWLLEDAGKSKPLDCQARKM